MERAAVELFVFLDRRLGSLQRHLDPIPAGESVTEFEGFGELIPGVEVEDKRVRSHRCQPVNDQAALGTERGGHRQPLAISLSRPGDDLDGLEALE